MSEPGDLPKPEWLVREEKRLQAKKGGATVAPQPASDQKPWPQGEKHVPPFKGLSEEEWKPKGGHVMTEEQWQKAIREKPQK